MIPIRQPQAFGCERNDRRCRVVNETLCGPVRQSGNAGQTPRFGIRLPRFAIGLDRTEQRTERALAFTAHEEVDIGRALVGLRREAGIVSAGDDARRGPKGAHQARHFHRGRTLKRHHRQADDVRLFIVQQPLERAADGRLDEDQVRNRHVVVRVDVAGERRERPVGHPDRHGGHVLERVRHRQQEDIHEISDCRFQISDLLQILLPLRTRRLNAVVGSSI